MYSIESILKSSVCECTIQNRLWSKFTARRNTVCLDVLKDIFEDYCNTRHGSIGIAPVVTSKKVNEDTVLRNLYGYHISVSKQPPKLKLGDS